MVTTLYLIRHGETEGDGVKRYKGSIDVPLSENGIRQMEQSAFFVSGHLRSTVVSRSRSYLRDIHKAPKSEGPEPDFLKAVYTSDLSRAVKSGEIIAAPHSVAPVIIPALRERSFGVWEGMSFVEIQERYPEEFRAWAGNPLEFSPVGGESTLKVRERAIEALDRILSMHKGDPIAIVAHGGINRIILCHIMGIPLENIFRIEQDFAGVNVIEFWGETPVVKLVNRGVDG